VMTGNLTNTMLSLLDTLFPGKPLTKGAGERLKNTLKVLIGFFAGCIAGAAAVSWLTDWAWSLPVLLAGTAVTATVGQDGILPELKIGKEKKVWPSSRER